MLGPTECSGGVCWEVIRSQRKNEKGDVENDSRKSEDGRVTTEDTDLTRKEVEKRIDRTNTTDIGHEPCRDLHRLSMTEMENYTT